MCNGAEPKAAPGPTAKDGGVLDVTMKDIDGADVKLADFKGKVVLIVNVASKCGLTPQYEQIQELHAKYGDKGLVILAFPANNFGGQEPGTNAEVKEFCSSRYHVGFKLFSKVSVKGDDICPLYSFLTSKEKNEKFAGEIKWNFTKFLIGRDGKVASRFEPKIKPDAKEVVEAIEAALAGKKD